ncbi:MAG: hypothetical protein RL748_4033 [Pseudomonadota bacterium]|jgi:hypothetical protein
MHTIIFGRMMYQVAWACYVASHQKNGAEIEM